MAIGSSTLGLLFKIGVDTSAIGSAFKEGLFDGAIKGSKDFEKSASTALERVGNSLQRTRSGFEELIGGDVLEGTIRLSRQFGVLAVGLGAVAVAGLAVKKSIEGILDVADKVGTDSKEDFEELQKSMARVGEQVTLLDHGLSQELVKAAGDVKTAFDAMFLEMLRKEGPALILLFKTIVDYIHNVLIPATDTWVKRQVEGIIQFIGLVRGLQAIQNLPEGLMGTDLRDFGKIIQSYVAQTRTELEGLTASLAGTTGTFNDHTKAVKTHITALKDLTQAQLEANEAARAFALLREKAAAEEEEINRELKAQAIDPDEAFARRLAIQQNITNAERDLLDAEKRRIELEVQGENNRTDALEANENKRKILEEQDAARQKELSDQATEDWNKYTEARLKQLDTILKRGQEVGDAVVKSQARAAQPIPGAGAGIPGLPDDATIQKGLDDAFKHYESFFERLKEGAASAGKVVRDELAQATENLPVAIVHAFEDAFKSLLDTFIKTGHTGPAVMRQFVSQVLQSIALLASQLAALAFGYALLMLAFQNYHDAALAAAAGIALSALAIGLGYASRAAAPSQAGQAAGGGGFGGTAAEPPGTVTINQGAGSGLGIQLQQLNALNNISNTLSTASPGDVVTRGAEQNPVAIGQANNEAARRDGTVSREFLQISGLRTA
jgi:hypothetical protein